MKGYYGKKVKSLNLLFVSMNPFLLQKRNIVFRLWKHFVNRELLEKSIIEMNKRYTFTTRLIHKRTNMRSELLRQNTPLQHYTKNAISAWEKKILWELLNSQMRANIGNSLQKQNVCLLWCLSRTYLTSLLLKF